MAAFDVTFCIISRASGRKTLASNTLSRRALQRSQTRGKEDPKTASLVGNRPECFAPAWAAPSVHLSWRPRRGPRRSRRGQEQASDIKRTAVAQRKPGPRARAPPKQHPGGNGLWCIRRGRRRRLGEERQRGTRRRLYWKHARARASPRPHPQPTRAPAPNARAPSCRGAHAIDAPASRRRRPPPIRSSHAR